MPPLQLIAGEEALPGYTLIQRLGRGGFGEVWECEAPGGFRKAIKFVFGDLDNEDEESRPALQERKALKRMKEIRHPYILTLEQALVVDGQLRIVMELADKNLWDRYRECRAQGLPGIPRDELLRYMEESAEALDLMNNHYHIQHLDIKPQNLFLVFSHVKVADFGLAKLLEGQRTNVTGGVTPVYAAPETFEGYVSRFSDQYSLAIVFQELLTGDRPFKGANTRQLLMQHITGTPDLQALPAADRPIIARALAKKPEDRWPTCTEMVRAIKLSGMTPPPSTPTSPKAMQNAARLEPFGPADSNQVTRVQFGGSGRLGQDPVKTQTPMPAYANPRPSISVAPGTPMPPLVTVGPTGQVVPRLITPSPSAANFNPAITLNRAQVFQTARMNSMGIAPPEENGDGTLFPALVVGVGHLGRLVVETLRTVICDHFGVPDKVPNVRFLCIDTDPAGAPSGGIPTGPASITAKEMVLARLNRPTHYLQRDTLPPVDQWLPPGVLYKLSRNPGSADGVRAFGRLALFDNYRVVAQRVRQEIETFLTGESITKADQATHLGLRTNRPRAYIVAGLGGGTGGGMFLDLAYLIRQELRSVGYLRPEVAGLFFVPPADRAGPKNTALGNTFTALTELFHFQAKRTRYQTTFDKTEPPVQDQDAPFARMAMVQLPKSIDPKGQKKVASRAARSLFNEILTPAGRVVDEVRDVYRNAFPSAAPTCQAFGLFRLTWPRPEMLASATRRFGQRLLQRWIDKDASSLREPVAAWIDSQWDERKLNFEQVVETFEGAARTQLREEPEKVFDAFVDPLRTRTPSGAKLDATAACSVLDQLLKLVGKPDPADTEGAGSLHAAAVARYQELCREGEAHLAFMAVTFIEQPQYRLAGSEEAVRQIGERLKRQVETLDPMHKELLRDVKQTYSRLLQTIGSLENRGSGWKIATEVLDLLRAYPRKRFRLEILELALSAFRKLLGSTPDYLRDIGSCRAALMDMNAAVAAGGKVGDSAGPGRLILPEGCSTLDDAADRFLNGLNPADVLALDQSLQQETSRKFRGLAAVCLKPLEKGPLFRELLLARSREFLDAKLDSADPAAVFFRNRTGGPEDYPLIGEAYKGAAPEMIGYNGKQPDELAILAAPAGEEGDRFRSLAAAALPGVEFTPAALPDDIVFYREYPRLEMTDLPQLGEHARKAAEAIGPDHPLHSRIDIPWTPAEMP